MRPVLLEMAGFASFREPTTVDFAGAEYFALVGPTGSGKSTVIDAMTFALYGSVPRWDNQRTVALALAPTAGRGAVRFVFDVGGRRYVVARELRRAAAGGVSVRTARLERLLDPAGSGAAEEETEPIADGAAATTAAVEELLGLPFGDFCTCVVLPQGDFAEFLHTEPRKRQEKLVRILGLGVYDEIARAANAEAAAQRLRAGVLAEQLGEYADATPEAERSATVRVAALSGLADRVAAAVPELAAAGGELRAAEALADRVHGERALLRALVVPAGTDRLHARERAAAQAVRTAVDRATEAETVDGDARSRLAGAPARGRLEQLRRDHAALSAGQAELPGIRERSEKALADYELAVQDAADARTALDGARAARDAAAAALDTAQELVRRLVAERARFRALAVPDGLDVLDRRRLEAATALERADAALVGAETADTEARAALAAAPPRGPLERARRDHQDLVDTGRRRGVAVAALATAEAELVAAGGVVTEARHRLEHVQALAAERQRGNLAAALRPALTAGADCPVCAQAVLDLPPPLPATDLDEAERSVEAAWLVHERGRSREAAAQAAHSRAVEAVAGLDETAGRLWSGVVGAVAEIGSGAAAAQDAAGRSGPAARSAMLFDRLAAAIVAVQGVGPSGIDGAPAQAGGDPAALGSSRVGGAPARDGEGSAAPDDHLRGALAAAVDEVLAALDRLAEAGATADTAVRAARRERAVAAGVVASLREEVLAASAELRAARDPLVPFGAPAIGPEDVLAGWTALVAWARAEAAERDAALPAARTAVDRGEADLDAADQAHRAAERAARDRRSDETAAARAEQEARVAVTSLEQSIERLRGLLADAPTDAEAAAELALRDELEAAAEVADAALRTARVELRAAERTATEIGQETGTAWERLRAARDPLVPLQAPALVGDDLLAAWSTLAAWARDREIAGEGQLRAATAAAGAATERWTAEAQRLAADLDEHGVSVPAASIDGLPGGPVDGLRGGSAPDRMSVGREPGGQQQVRSAARRPLDRSPAEVALPVVAAALERARGDQRRLAERRAAAASIAADRDAAESAHQVAKMLGGLLRSDGFPRWLVASALDALVADASASLLDLSGGQFELTHAGGEFLVIDHADADARRPVKTLSGGETFQASLALALALSTQMSGLAARGAARLESIFLDEGFGTLDEANLETVASTLENLAARGDRVVGLITHVPALAERVPVRFAVSRDERTSSVVREEA